MSFALSDRSGPTLGVVPVGLAPEPPLSPTVLGRPAGAEPPVQPVPAPSPEPVHVPEPEAAGEGPAVWAVEDADAGPRRVVVRLAGGEDVELGEAGSRDEAFALAREVVSEIGAAEAGGEWPELGGRLVRPAAIVSVDVLRPI